MSEGIDFSNIRFLVFLSVLMVQYGCGPTKDSPHKETLSTTPPSHVKEVQPRSERHSSGVQPDEVVTTKATIGWNEPIRLNKFGLAPNANIEGKTLKMIVESLSPGRDDQLLCSACHNSSEAAGNYGIQVEKNKPYLKLNPWVVLGTTLQKSWAGTEGWADEFSGNSTKPPALRTLMRSWKAGGYQIEPLD